MRHRNTTNKSKEQLNAELNQIRRLKEDGLSDAKIIYQLQIDRSTFYRHLNRINKGESKIWKYYFLDPNLIKARDVQLTQVLERGLAHNLKQMDNEHLDPRERRECSIAAATFAAHLSKLAREGPTFNVLPEVKARILTDEVKPIEDKQF